MENHIPNASTPFFPRMSRFRLCNKQTKIRLVMLAPTKTTLYLLWVPVLFSNLFDYRYGSFLGWMHFSTVGNNFTVLTARLTFVEHWWHYAAMHVSSLIRIGLMAGSFLIGCRP